MLMHATHRVTKMYNMTIQHTNPRSTPINMCYDINVLSKLIKTRYTIGLYRNYKNKTSST